MSAAPSRLEPLAVLVVLQDPASCALIEQEVAELGDRLLLTADPGEALHMADRECVHLALVDIGLDEGAALALVHHLLMVSPGAVVVALVTQAQAIRGPDALAVGAEALLALPLNGDALHRVLGMTRSRILEARERLALSAELSSERRRREPALLLGTLEERHLYSSTYLHAIGNREIERAKRYGRRLSAVALKGAWTRALALALLAVLRSSDLVAELSPDTLIFLLPETNALGAHACRRRLLAHVKGEQRARPTLERGATPSVGFGVSTFPHDGGGSSALFRAASTRATEDFTSVVHAYDLGAHPLADLVDSLAARPLFDAGARSILPLDLPISSLTTVVEQACEDARRGGHTTFIATDQPGRSLGAIARSVLRPQAAPPRAGPARTERRAEPTYLPGVEVRDVRSLPRCGDVEAVVLRAEHGSWVCCGRLEHQRFRGIHAADPLLADLVADRLAEGLSPTGGS